VGYDVTAFVIFVEGGHAGASYTWIAGSFIASCKESPATNPWVVVGGFCEECPSSDSGVVAIRVIRFGVENGAAVFGNHKNQPQG